jgi:pSer/pThr/pTyr-binding forkhead associated (FHA) protein
MAAVLVVESGDNDSSVFAIERDRNIIGKAPGADIALSNAFVSREHAEIRVAGNRHQLVDLGSKNGTSVNGGAVPRTGRTLSNGRDDVLNAQP